MNKLKIYSLLKFGFGPPPHTTYRVGVAMVTNQWKDLGICGTFHEPVALYISQWKLFISQWYISKLRWNISNTVDIFKNMWNFHGNLSLTLTHTQTHTDIYINIQTQVK